MLVISVNGMRKCGVGRLSGGGIGSNGSKNCSNFLEDFRGVIIKKRR